MFLAGSIIFPLSENQVRTRESVGDGEHKQCRRQSERSRRPHLHSTSSHSGRDWVETVGCRLKGMERRRKRRRESRRAGQLKRQGAARRELEMTRPRPGQHQREHQQQDPFAHDTLGPGHRDVTSVLKLNIKVQDCLCLGPDPWPGLPFLGCLKAIVAPGAGGALPATALSTLVARCSSGTGQVLLSIELARHREAGRCHRPTILCMESSPANFHGVVAAALGPPTSALASDGMKACGGRGTYSTVPYVPVRLRGTSDPITVWFRACFSYTGTTLT